MGFGTQNQLGNRTGVTNQTSLADLFGGGGGNISPPGLGQDGQQNQLFTILQQLLGGQGGLQAPGGQTQQPPIGGIRQPPRENTIGQTSPFGTALPGTKPGVGFAPPPGKGFGDGQITPIGLGQQFNGFGGTPLTQLSNPFGNLINQRAIR